MSSALVYIIVLNWRNAKETLNCLSSLRKMSYANYKIVICDNDSQDTSIECFEKWCEKEDINYVLYNEAELQYEDLSENRIPDVGLYIIENKKNYGYAGGNNVGIKFALNDKRCAYVWILNNDVTVAPDALSNLHNKMESNTQLAICGSLLLHQNNPDVIQAAGGIFNKTLCTTKHLLENRSLSSIRDAELHGLHPDYVVGASMFIKRKLIESEGLLFEDYFLYYEEIDYCLRASKKYIIGIDTSSHVYHKVGDSIKKGKSDLADYLSVRNRLIVSRRFYPGSFFIVWLSMIIAILNRLRRKQFKRAMRIVSIMLIHSWLILFKYKSI